ncbi:hypothetical protein CI109_103309 [Kwoniella shandongensis]|uniref:Protein byr4 n=1 Tax=Kwoniella shandongensis TaxID=1734106 RepID=A0A5M6BNL6_9TREE|nr:uncharacterized protein CI109_007191 [Kwoniella shandongensis]KAA5524484.1 hypothetical protein CI109_007191 [Kwoniella shandongensis]
MSPVPPPPPAGTFVPSDDWTDDPSFDLSPSAGQFALPSSPSSSSNSSTSHHLTSNDRNGASSSPLRKSFTTIPSASTSAAGHPSTKGNGGTLKLKKFQMKMEDDNFDEFDFDLPTTLPPQRNRSSTATSSTSSNSHITRTVVGQGPTGIGTITRLGSGSSPAILAGSGTLKAKAKAVEKSWEADVDFGDEYDDDDLDFGGGLGSVSGPSKTGTLTLKSFSKRLTLSPPTTKKGFMPPPEALDDLGFEDLEDEDQATLKAGATIKAMLPPPRNRQAAHPTPAAPPVTTPPTQDPDANAFDFDLETDFALPLNLTNLTLATQPIVGGPHRGRGATGKPRVSNASTTNTDWDSPGTSSGKRSHPSGWGWDSPTGGAGKRLSETSVTSVSDGVGDSKSNKKDTEMMDEEEDMEMGLVLPSPTFFSNSNQRANELNSILDRKRKPQYAPPPTQTAPTHHVASHEHRRGPDDSFEDGLVLYEPGVELSRHRLREKKRARDRYPASGTLTRKGGLVAAAKSVVKEREKAWEKQREQGWARVTPGGSASSREKLTPHGNGSGLGLSLRSNSASAMTILREGSGTPSTTLTRGEKESMRSRSGHLLNMMPPPPPPPQPLPPTPSTTSRLRHQKSHYHITSAPPQSPSLTRKQSLASLQDALASDRTLTGIGETPSSSSTTTTTTRYHNSTSRLTMPTSSSRAKIRQPISAVFPLPTSNSTPTPSSSASSIASMGVVTPRYRYQSGGSATGNLLGQRKGKTWGDGTELDAIDDLAVDEGVSGVGPRGAAVGGIGLGKPSRRAGNEPSSNHKTPHLRRPSEQDKEKRKKSGSGLPAPTPSEKTGSWSKRTRRKPAGLIKHLGGADKKKVVGEMTWNPATLRWEGNESILQAFDHIPSRPALITHYTGGSSVTSPISSSANITPATAAATAPRIVGDMQFDPINMRWISILDPEDDEPDPFEGMADDEESESGGAGGTITKSNSRKFVIPGGGGMGMGSGSVVTSSAWSSRMISESGTSVSASIGSSSWGGGTTEEISDELWKECKEAEERHKKEVRGWLTRPSTTITSESRDKERREEKRLWEIRHLALKS